MENIDIQTTFSVALTTEQACREVVRNLSCKHQTPPQFVVCYYSANYQYLQIAKNLQFAFKSSQIIACSSCQGVMTADGFHSVDGRGLALWAIWDPFGKYGTALESFKNISEKDIYKAVQKALSQALENAGRPGELPELIWLHVSPGYEERVIAAIEDMVGKQVPIAGGSAADQRIQGDWSLFNQDSVATQGVAVVALFPGGEIGYSFHSGYVASRALGAVTASHHRVVYSIDNKPAADVYWKAVGKSSLRPSKNLSILKPSAFHPIGRMAGRLEAYPFFKLAHPRALTEEGGIELFTEIQKGDELYLMEGSRESLIHRGGRVTQMSLTHPFSHIQPVGALVIYCAGCMMAIHGDIDAVVDSVCESLGDGLPFLGAFTFGEQGHFLTGENGHGNLMSSAVVFYQRVP